MKTTSIHSLNADKGLGPMQKIAYLFLNFLNVQLPYTNVDPRIHFKAFPKEAWKQYWVHTYKESSAARKLSDLFWWTYPWEEVKKKLGNIHIFDTGCGSGNYGVRIAEASGGLVNSYIGIDAKEKPMWEEIRKNHPHFHLIRSTSNSITSHIPPETNLFITQTAIEHFDEDLLFFEQIKTFIDTSKKPVIQIHVFPAAATMPLYLFHGIRQYNPRTISKITRMFPDAHITLMGLGGTESKKIHFKYFTWPVLFMRRKAASSKNPEKYDAKLYKAIEKDTERISRHPMFWVLIIESNLSRNTE
jgi:hypothetical protein